MRVLRFLPLVLLLVFTAAARGVEPPIVTLRPIGTLPREAKGDWFLLAEHAELFLPEGFTTETLRKDEKVLLTMHFHGANWWAAEEHWRRGSRNPLLIYWGMEGSSRYRVPFEGTRLFEELLAKAEERVGAPLGPVEIQSFSAGYGAVREILKTPEYVEKIDAIALGDSFYASFAVEGGGEDRAPLPEHMAPFIGFAEKAMTGEKTFIVAFCQIVTPEYASTEDTGKALVRAVGGGEMELVDHRGPAAADQSLPYPLLYQYDKGGLHVWGYGGNDPKAHMAMARTIADYWKAVEGELAARRGE